MADQPERRGENRRNALQKMLGLGAGLAASSELLAQQTGEESSRPAEVPSAPGTDGLVLFAFDDRWLPLQHGLRLNLVSYQSAEGAPVTNMAVPPGPPGAPDSSGILRRI